MGISSVPLEVDCLYEEASHTPSSLKLVRRWIIMEGGEVLHRVVWLYVITCTMVSANNFGNYDWMDNRYSDPNQYHTNNGWQDDYYNSNQYQDGIYMSYGDNRNADRRIDSWNEEPIIFNFDGSRDDIIQDRLNGNFDSFHYPGDMEMADNTYWSNNPVNQDWFYECGKSTNGYWPNRDSSDGEGAGGYWPNAEWSDEYVEGELGYWPNDNWSDEYGGGEGSVQFRVNNQLRGSGIPPGGYWPNAQWSDEYGEVEGGYRPNAEWSNEYGESEGGYWPNAEWSDEYGESEGGYWPNDDWSDEYGKSEGGYRPNAEWSDEYGEGDGGYRPNDDWSD